METFSFTSLRSFSFWRVKPSFYNHIWTVTVNTTLHHFFIPTTIIVYCPFLYSTSCPLTLIVRTDQPYLNINYFISVSNKQQPAAAPRHSVLTHDGFAVAGSSFQVLAAQKQAVPLLLQLLSRHRGALLRAFRHLVHQARCSGGSCPFTLLPYPDALIGRAGRKLRRQEPKNRWS